MDLPAMVHSYSHIETLSPRRGLSNMKQLVLNRREGQLGTIHNHVTIYLHSILYHNSIDFETPYCPS